MTELSKLTGPAIGLFIGILWAAGWWSMFADQPLLYPRSALVIVAALLTVVLAVASFRHRTRLRG
ncbi:MAG: hypothetical protein M3P27_03585 [Acidobacteriota bacterium]|nr:hypothetical protein [Acidobacteriota bacterium]